MLADIANGNTALADVMFLVALIVFVLAGFVAYGAKALWASVVCIGFAAMALGWLVL